MADDRKFEIDELLVRPGTYFNPQTEVLVTVDDSTSLESEIFNMEQFEGADWVLISDESPIDEQVRDELMQAFQVRHGSALTAGLSSDDEIVDDDENAEPEADEVEEL